MNALPLDCKLTLWPDKMGQFEYGLTFSIPEPLFLGDYRINLVSVIVNCLACSLIPKRYRSLCIMLQMREGYSI